MASLVGTTVIERVKLLFLVTEDWYFCSHRLALGVAAVHAGWEVVVVTRVRAHQNILETSGIRVIPWEHQRGSLNPWQTAKALFQLFRIYKREQPDLVHHVALKPVLYGGLISLCLGIRHQINALAGLGWLYSSSKWFPKVLGFFVAKILRQVLSSGICLVQNPDDWHWVERLGVCPEQIKLIKGSGVDIRAFKPASKIFSNTSIPTIMVVSRMLQDKGIVELVNASQLLQERQILCRIVLVGDSDLESRATILESDLLKWENKGLIEWWRHRNNIAQCYAQADIACLPSYREGLPKSLLEAAACGLPIVTSDVPGCREVVQHQENGLLVQVRNALSLANALETLLINPELRLRMGQRSRSIAEQEFAVERVIEQTFALYRELLA